jgi:hypothetical protein
VAGAGALLLDPDPHRVLVAIDARLDDALRMTGGFALEGLIWRFSLKATQPLPTLHGNPAWTR